MSTGTRRPSLSRYPSVALERQSSITSHSSNAFFDEQEETSSSGRTIVAEKEGIWNTTRRKLTLVSLCLVYFAATASFAILSPFFPSEVSYVNDFSPKFRLRRVESHRAEIWPGFDCLSPCVGCVRLCNVYFRISKVHSSLSFHLMLYQKQSESSPGITLFFSYLQLKTCADSFFLCFVFFSRI